MVGRSDSDRPHDEVLTSDSYLQDLVNAVVYGVLGVAAFYGSLVLIAFVYDRGGGTAAEFATDAFAPPSTDPATLAPYLFAYVGFLGAAVSFAIAGYSAVVSPILRLVGVTGAARGSEPGGDEHRSRVVVSVTTTEGIQRFLPDCECVDCEERAIGVLSTAFEAGAPSRVVPACPMHLHERRDEHEAQSHRVEVETFV